MTMTETRRIVALTSELWPSKVANVDKRVEAWHLVLSDYPYETVKDAVLAFARNSNTGFPPSVGQIVQGIPRTPQETVKTGKMAMDEFREAEKGLVALWMELTGKTDVPESIGRVIA